MNRRGFLGSSDAPIIRGLSPWCTPRELWEIKTGRREVPPGNWATERGIRLEAEAREAYQERTGRVVRPTILVHAEFPWMRSAPDGMDFDGSVVTEIKVPGAEDLFCAIEGRVPEKYLPQVWHHLAVSGAQVCEFWCYYRRDEDAPEQGRGALVVVERDDDAIEDLIAAEAEFWRLIETDTPPPLTERDALMREDKEWLDAATLYREAEAAETEWAAKKDAARQLLVSLMGENGHPKMSGGGVTLTRSEVRGSIKYTDVPALKAMDLEAFRGPSRVQYRVTVER